MNQLTTEERIARYKFLKAFIETAFEARRKEMRFDLSRFIAEYRGHKTPENLRRNNRVYYQRRMKKTYGS